MPYSRRILRNDQIFFQNGLVCRLFPSKPPSVISRLEWSVSGKVIWLCCVHLGIKIGTLGAGQACQAEACVRIALVVGPRR